MDSKTPRKIKANPYNISGILNVRKSMVIRTFRVIDRQN